jgi:hypothetical protein
MIRSMPKRTQFEWMKRAIFYGLCIYSVATTALIFKLNPVPVVIGIDSYGTRIVTGEKDPIIKAEREAFVSRFISNLYNYDETNFDERISLVGDLMKPELWDEKKAEYLSVSSRLKVEPLSQKSKILDLREVDETHFEADLSIHIQSRLRSNHTQVRVTIEISQAPRSSVKPYPWEVIHYVEQTAN